MCVALDESGISLAQYWKYVSMWKFADKKKKLHSKFTIKRIIVPSAYGLDT